MFYNLLSILNTTDHYCGHGPNMFTSCCFFHSTTNTPDDVSSRYSRAADRTGYNRYSRDANSSGNILPNNSLEKKVEDLEKVNV